MSESEKQTATTTVQAPARESGIARLGMRFADWSERWFPDAFVFVIVALIIVVAAALAIGASPQVVVDQFGTGFWNLIPFTMQMALIIIGGFVVAVSPPVSALIERLATLPRNGRSAVAFIAFFSMLTSLLSWGFSLIFSGLLVRALARRQPHMDYRAAGAAAYLGLGATWALGLSSSAALFQANPGSIPKALLPITGIIPFSETIFLWQSIVMAIVLIVVAVAVAYFSAPSEQSAKSAKDYGVADAPLRTLLTPRGRPGEWLEYAPLLSIVVAALGLIWIVSTMMTSGALVAISNLNTYNFIFLMAGLLLNWRPRRFLQAVSDSVPATAGVLIQFPFYAAIAAILTGAKGTGGVALAGVISHAFVSISTQQTFPLLVGIYSAIVGLFVPSGGGKWVIEAPYVMQAANTLHVNLGWIVQIYNASEALPNLINPFWMLPLLGVLGVKARELVGYSFLQFIVHVPIVLFLVWLFAQTLPYHAPILP